MSIRRWRGAAAVLLVAVATSTLPVPASAQSSLRDARVARIEALSLREGPSLALSTVYAAVPQDQRVALLAKLRDMLLARLPSQEVIDGALATMPPEQAAMARAALRLAKAVTPEQLEAAVAGLDLDHLLPLPAAVFRAVHDGQLAAAGPGRVPRSQILARDLADPTSWLAQVDATDGYADSADPVLDELVLLEPADPVPPDEIPADAVVPTAMGPLVEATFIQELPAHALVNSARLARALNHLSRARRRVTPFTLRVGDRSWTVSSGAELVTALRAADRWDMAVFDARMFVDFLGYSALHGDVPVPVRIPTWALSSAPVEAGGSRRLMIPLNHSEHVLVLFEKGSAEPAAQVKWYMGIPGAGTLHQGTRFKAATTRRGSWSGYRIVRWYETPDAVRQLVDGGAALMRLYNFLQTRYAFPMNGYGMLAVCQDTTGVMEVMLQGAAGRTTVWPLYRDPDLDFYYAPVVERLGLRLGAVDTGGRILDVPSDARPDRYPWVADERIELYRVGANVPARELGDLHFPEVASDLQTLGERSAELGRGLALRP